ncbi:uncharacterized protein LOC100205676 isoform X1 [Hydra vulgaris]|uniref:uncharacterized protein LOC100205676 isoform X1 n=1 Tax=Hydra vulgaris TaxID=6087 RepID=UPI0002B440C4|nr:uncharacterized protein LOC100205676 [Hydra vulgaris]XP_047146551.1 uncharacterized protein LOC100205676 [Hydra vulgaris]
MKFFIMVVALMACYGYSVGMTNQEKRALTKRVLKEILVDNKDQIESYIRQMIKDTLASSNDGDHVNNELRNILKIETESEAKNLYEKENLYDKIKPKIDRGIDTASQEKELLGNENSFDSNELEDENKIKQVVNLLDNVPKYFVDQYYKEKAALEEKKSFQKSLSDFIEDIPQKKHLNPLEDKIQKSDQTKQLNDEDDDIELENIIDEDEAKNHTKLYDNNNTDEDINSLLNESIKKELKDKVKAKITQKFKDVLLGRYLQKKEDFKTKISEKLKKLFGKKSK